ncbi:MAG TPA: PAS domain S-box protein [Stenomitos sp.]
MPEQQDCQEQLEAAQEQIQQLSQQLATERETARQIQMQLQGQIKQQQQCLAQLELQDDTYRNLFDCNPQPMWVYDLQTLQFLAVNDAAITKYGYSRTEFLSMTLVAIYCQNDVPRLLANMAQRNSGLDMTSIRWHCLRDGRIIAVEIVSYTLEFEGRRAELVLVQDMTNRLEIDQALLRSAEHYRLLVELAPQIVWSADAAGLNTYVSGRMSEYIGLPPEQLINFDWQAVIHPDDVKRVHDRWMESVQTKRPYELEYRLRRADGEYRWHLVQATCVEHDPEIQWLGMSTDIHERKQAQLALQELNQALEQQVTESTAALAASEAHLNLLLNASLATTYSCQLNRDFACNFISNNVETLLGYTPEEFRSEPDFWMQRLHPDDVAQVLADIPSVFEHGILKLEYRMRHCEGHYVWIHDELTVVRDEAGTPIQLVGFIRDISDRKQAELALTAYATQVEDLYNNAPCGYCSLDAYNRITRINNTALRWLGCSRQEVQEQVITQFMLPDSRQVFAQQRDLLTQSGQARRLDYEINLLSSDGGQMAVLFSDEVQKDADGTILESRITITDIRQRVRAERLVQQQLTQENLLRQITARIRQSLDLSTIFATACNEVQQALQADRVAIFRFTPESNFNDGEFIAESNVGNYPSVLSAPVHDHCFGENFARLYAQGRYYAVADIEAGALSDCHADIFRQFQVRATLIVPLLDQENTLWGLFCVHQCGQLRQWSTPEIDLVQQLADQLAIAINQAKLFEQLQQELSIRQLAEQELAERNQQLSLSNQALARATRLKDEFLANMSHELRTPLNAILGMTEGLQEGIFGSINERQLSALNTVERSSTHLLSLINDILDVAKIESGQLTLTYSPIDVQQLCSSSMAFVQQQALRKRIQLHAQIPQSLPALFADEVRMRQMLLNLLTNAVKFTPEGGQVTLSVVVCAHAEDPSQPTYLRFAVADTGIGIAPENIPKLFQPFVQIDGALNRQQTGTGLGLALVRQIVELHGGQVGLTSELGVGSCFTVDLPHMRSTSLPNTPEFEHTRSAVSDIISNQGPLVLLAEDNAANVATLSSYLQAKGYRLMYAVTGREAINLSLVHRPDLILMDIQMPEVDGLEAIRQIRQHASLRETPIIALTALVMKGDRERCLAAGANAYLSKPVKLKQLNTSIKTLLADCKPQ